MSNTKRFVLFAFPISFTTLGRVLSFRQRVLSFQDFLFQSSGENSLLFDMQRIAPFAACASNPQGVYDGIAVWSTDSKQHLFGCSRWFVSPVAWSTRHIHTLIWRTKWATKHCPTALIQLFLICSDEPQRHLMQTHWVICRCCRSLYIHGHKQ